MPIHAAVDMTEDKQYERFDVMKVIGAGSGGDVLPSPVPIIEQVQEKEEASIEHSLVNAEYTSNAANSKLLSDPSLVQIEGRPVEIVETIITVENEPQSTETETDQHPEDHSLIKSEAVNNTTKSKTESNANIYTVPQKEGEFERVAEECRRIYGWLCLKNPEFKFPDIKTVIQETFQIHPNVIDSCLKYLEDTNRIKQKDGQSSRSRVLIFEVIMPAGYTYEESDTGESHEELDVEIQNENEDSNQVVVCPDHNQPERKRPRPRPRSRPQEIRPASPPPHKSLPLINHDIQATVASTRPAQISQELIDHVMKVIATFFQANSDENLYVGECILS